MASSSSSSPMLQDEERLAQQQQKHQSPVLEDCLKLLGAERDEQRLAGLLLVTKICEGDDHPSIRRVYDAVGVRFLDRLLRTGMGSLKNTGGHDDNRDVYLQLSVTILAAFCRVPQIAAADEMVAKIPLILQIMTRQLASNILEECYEFLLLVSTSHEDGVTAVFESGGLKVLASHMPSLTHGSQNFELSIRLLQLVVGKISPDIIIIEYLTELSIMVSSIAQQFAVLQNALKFQLLHLLSIILSWHHLGPLADALHSISNNEWATHVQAGIVDILQSRVAVDQKLQALVVSQSMVSMLGEGWLIGQVNLDDSLSSIPSNRCLFLVLELSRVEVAVLLNDLGYLKYEASSSKTGEIAEKEAKLSIAFFLLEKIIKLISEVCENEGSVITEGDITKVISGLNETTGLVLEYLNDAKDHGQRRGDDLLASVRFVGSYLAETPLAWKLKVEELLGYILSVEGEQEQSPFLSIAFFLPMLYQITRETEGSKVLASSGGYKAVVGCLIELLSPSHQNGVQSGSEYLACNTLINLLLMREEIHVKLEEPVFVPLLRVFALWAGQTEETPLILVVSSVCCLIFEHTAEEYLLRYPDFDYSTLSALSRLILRSLNTMRLETRDGTEASPHLHEIIIRGFHHWADRFPHVRKAVGGLI